MTTEEIKMVADTISSLGANGKEAFIYWLVFTNAVNVITTFLVATTAIYIVKMVVTKLASDNDIEAFLRITRDRMRIGRPGHLLDEERLLVFKKLTELTDEHLNNKKEK